MPLLLALIPALSAAPLAGDVTSFPAPATAGLSNAARSSGAGGGNAFSRALGGGLVGSVGGGFLGYWAARNSNGGMEPGTGGLVGTASGMVLGSALGAWSARDPGADYAHPLPPVLGATIGGALGVGVWGLAAMASGTGSSDMSWQGFLLLLGAPWIGSALGAGIEQDMTRRSAAVTPWFPATGGAGLQVALRY